MRTGACGGVHLGDGVRIFRPDIDITLGRADREASNRHPFDQLKGVALHRHAVGKGAAVAFIRIADDIFLVRLGIGYGAPFDPSGKACAPPTTQARRN